jgi:hypothetical protein
LNLIQEITISCLENPARTFIAALAIHEANSILVHGSYRISEKISQKSLSLPFQCTLEMAWFVQDLILREKFQVKKSSLLPLVMPILDFELSDWT